MYLVHIVKRIVCHVTAQIMIYEKGWEGKFGIGGVCFCITLILTLLSQVGSDIRFHIASFQIGFFFFFFKIGVGY